MGPDLDAAVVGGGISGLSAAWALRRAGLRVALFEKRHRTGGRIASTRSGGFLMEHGPNLLVGPATAVDTLVSGLALSEARIRSGERVRHRYLVRRGHAHALPLDPLGFLSSGFFSLRARLRLLAEPFVAPVVEDESVARFAARRFGREFLDYLVDPLVGGLSAGDPAQLSAVAALPRLKRIERESGSIMVGLLRARLRRAAPSALDPRQRELFSFRDGLATLPQALSAELSSAVATGAEVQALRPGASSLRLRAGDREVTARCVVLALPAYAAAPLVEPLDSAAAHALRAIPHPPLAVVFLGYPPEAIRHPLDGLGVLMPSIERRGVLGMLFSSTLFAGRAPEGQAAITAYVGGAREPGLAAAPPEELVNLVHQEVRQLFGARLKPVHARVRYWRHGLPQPGLGHAQRVESLRALEARLPGLFFAGNYLSGASTAACVEEALAAAQRVVQRHPAPGTAEFPTLARRAASG
jgi:oxygen-dependent protoporphyrinogen oxidase